MTSLYRRASPPQARVLRIVEGAIKNAADAHAEIQVSARHRRSIAKRAAGTLTAQWPEVLAATRRSGDSAKVAPPKRARGSSLRSRSLNTLIRLSMKRVAEGQFDSHGEAGGVGLRGTLPLLALAETCLKACAGPIGKRDDAELYEAVVAVLRLLGRCRKSAVAGRSEATITDGHAVPGGRSPTLQAINTSRLTEIERLLKRAASGSPGSVGWRKTATKLQHERLADELREAGR